MHFDRLCDAKLIPIEGEWRKSGLDSVEVEFELLGELAHAYEVRQSDKCDLIESNSDLPKRVVKRNIYNTFWFIREMLPYGKDCVIVAPTVLRDRLVKELKAALENY